MKTILGTVVISLFSLIAFGNNYTSYYSLCNSADKLVYLKKYSEALKMYDSAFSTVEYIHSFKYQKASKCAIMANDFEKAFLFARNSILNGSTRLFWKDRKLKSFRKSKYYNMLNDSVNDYQNIHLISINKEYKEIIDSLHYLDQRIIRKNKSCNGNYSIDSTLLPDNIWDLDSMIFQELLSLIDRFGFPSERLLGVKGYNNASILIHHNFRLEKNEQYHSIVINALYNGEYRPRDFEFMYEQYNVWFKENTFFSSWDRNTSKENIERLNKNREEYCLKDLSSFRLKNRGLKMKSIW